MPLEVRELIIKATVTQEGSGAATAAPTGGNNGNSSNEEQLKQALEKILDTLKDKNER
ncbi:MAG: DUF5908 family protein [Pseudobacter sp.]|uniref:DUF5908 family protein n=1 Tax=Pseudobacter sp. TaxID=2045420 RepID=UPI003F7D8B33